MLLWIIFALMTAAALVAVIFPLGRGAASRTAGNSSLSVYRDQLSAVEADIDKGLLDEAEAEAARTEISRRLIAAADAGDGAKGPPATPARHGMPAMLLSAFIVAASLGGYLALGSPGLDGQPAAQRQQQPLESRSLADLVSQMEAHLNENPQSGRGWATVAPVYMRMRQFSKAARAFSRAIALEGATAARYGGYGEALTMEAGGVITQQAREAFVRARELEPELIRPRFFLGIAHEQDGDWAAAAAAWREILAVSPEQAPFRPVVERKLAAAEANIARSQPGPTAEDVKNARELSAGQRNEMINQMVAGLAARLDEDGGTVEEWLRLIRSYAVLGRTEDARAAADKARSVLAGDEAALARIDALARRLAPGGDKETETQ